MSIIERVKGHFDTLGVRTIEVPEWPDADGRPLVIYCRPMTMADKQKIANAAGRDGHVAMLAHTLLIKAEDSQGNKLFTIEHKHDLMNRADPEVVARIVIEMNKVATVEDQEKNSTRTPTSL